MRGTFIGKSQVRAWAVAAVCIGLAGAVWARQPVDPPPPPPPADAAAIEAAEKAAQQMEDMFEDMPVDFDPAGMTSGRGAFGAMFGPSVTKADFKSYITILGLDKDQAAAAETVYAQRLANYEAKGKPFQDLIMDALKGFGEAMSRGEPEREPENIEQLSKAGDEIQREREDMAKGVMEDLKALATEAQLERWPKVEMAERRNILMRFQPMMMSPGSLVDVREVVETTLAKPGIEPPVEMGKQRIAEALEARDLALDEHARVVMPIDATMRTSSIRAKPTPEETEAMMKAMGEGMRIAERVRKTNEAAVKSVAAVMPDATRAAFMEEYQRRAFPVIYREMHGERVLAAAAALGDLDEEQRAKIAAMRDEHAAKLKELRPKAAEQAILQQEFQAEMMSAKDDEARMKAATRLGEVYQENARSRMKEMDREVVKQVRAMLTEAQRAKLPKRPKPNLPFEITPGGDDGSK